MTDSRADEVIAAFLDEAAAGREPDRAELLARQPDRADERRSFLVEHDRMRPAAQRIRSSAGPEPAAGSNEAVTAGTAVRYFGDYEVLGEIARGGMGVVYRARQVSLGRTVALKMILAGQFASAE